MLAIAVWYLRNTEHYRKYFTHIKLFLFRWSNIGRLLTLSIPIMIDKSSLSFSYVWLSKMIAPMGPQAIATFDIIKNLERSAIMPAAAFAQVIMFLVSNRIGAQDFKGSKGKHC